MVKNVRLIDGLQVLVIDELVELVMVEPGGVHQILVGDVRRIDRLLLPFGAGISHNKLRLGLCTTIDFGDRSVGLRLGEVDLSAVSSSFLLFDFCPLLLSGDLRLDQRVLTKLRQLDLDDLERDALGVELLQLLVDSQAQLLTLGLSILPEGVVLEGGHMFADGVLDPAAEGALVAQLQLSVEISHLLLDEAVLNRKRQLHLLTVRVLH